MNQKNRIDVRTLAVLAMLSAIACVLMLIVRINFMPAAPFLIYDPKDIIIVIGGFLYGPLAVIPMALIVAFVEMYTVSADGWVGFLMGVISSCAFSVPAALIYKHKHTLAGALIGLVVGWLFVTGVMVLWNYIVTPVYRGFPREAIIPMLPTVFMPFNLIKYGLGAATTMLIYKPLSLALKKMNILKKTERKASIKENFIIGVILAVCLAVIPCIFLVLVLRGVI